MGNHLGWPAWRWEFRVKILFFETQAKAKTGGKYERYDFKPDFTCKASAKNQYSLEVTARELNAKSRHIHINVVNYTASCYLENTGG